MKNNTAFHYGYIIVACCCLMMGINVGIAFSCAGIMYKPICTSLGVSTGEFGMYMSVMYIMSSLVLPYAGKLLERYSARLLFTGASAVMGITLATMAFYTRVWEFYVAGAIMGVTLAYLLYLGFPTLINRWFRSRVGLMTGICTAASGVGGIVLNPIAGYIIETYDWRWTYIFFAAVVLLIVTPLLGWLIRDYPSDRGVEPYSRGIEKETRPKGSAVRGVEYSKALHMPIFYGLLVFAFLMMAASTLNLFIPNYVRWLDYDTEMAAYAASSVMAGVTIGKLLLGHINDRNCMAGVMVTTFAGIIGLALLFLGQSGMFVIVLGTFLFGWAYAGVMVQSAMLTRTVFGSLHYARIYGGISIALAAGGAIASGMWGWIVDATSYHAIFAIGIGMLLLSAAIGVWALRPHKI